MAEIFISYRREDSESEALLLRDAVRREFGTDSVLLDASLGAGAEWEVELTAGIDAADTVLAVVGPEWLRAGSDEWGQRRIDQEEDWVRYELSLALRDKKTVIPVLVRGGKLPPANVLPEDLKGLVGRQAIELRPSYWDHDIQLLLAQLGPRTAPSETIEGIGSPYPRCFPEGPDPIADEKLDRILSRDLRAWEKVVSALPEGTGETRVELCRRFDFKSFADAIRFMSQVAPGCDMAMHHPRWENIWQTITVYLSTWDIGHQVSDRDVQLARYFDRAYADFTGAVEN